MTNTVTIEMIEYGLELELKKISLISDVEIYYPFQNQIGFKIKSDSYIDIIYNLRNDKIWKASFIGDVEKLIVVANIINVFCRNNNNELSQLSSYYN